MKKEQLLTAIKPLDWDDDSSRGVCCLYQIKQQDNLLFYLRCVPDNYNGENDPYFPDFQTIESAKTAAEQLHQEDVLGYLNFEQ